MKASRYLPLVLTCVLLLWLRYELLWFREDDNNTALTPSNHHHPILVSSTATNDVSPATTTAIPSVPPTVHFSSSESPLVSSSTAPRAASSSSRSSALLVTGYNPTHCRVQPNITPIDPYKGCPLPGLNNLLFTQHNRWYCALRDNRALHLRDRTCNKGSREPFRFSTILQIDYEALRNEFPGRPQSAICWSDISRQDVAPHCEWGDIPRFYGNELWWSARRLIDFHKWYYEVADHFVELTFSGEPFLVAHLRRGDYGAHCVVVQRRGTPKWLSFRDTPTLYPLKSGGCYPSLQQVRESLEAAAVKSNIRNVFIATNDRGEFANFTVDSSKIDRVVVSIPDAFFHSVQKQFASSRSLRKLDYLIVEMAVMSRGNYWLFNRYSSLSGTVYEMARIHGRTRDDNVVCW